jgi:hypothetical protein
MTKFYDVYKAVFDAVEAALENVETVKTVVQGGRFKLQDFPMVVISPLETGIRQASLGSMLENTVRFSVTVLVRETEPEDWFADVISVMGDVFDKLLSDRTLSGTVSDLTPTFFSPGEIRTQAKLFYGGELRFECLLYFSP